MTTINIITSQGIEQDQVPSLLSKVKPEGEITFLCQHMEHWLQERASLCVY